MSGKPSSLDAILRPTETGFGPDFDREYSALPESIKMLYSPKEWAWLGASRHTVVDQECLPDVFED